MQEPIDLDMESCLTEMERLQAKMIELKEQQQREVLENEKKAKNIDPNMMVIQEWLDNYSHNKKQKGLAEQAKKKRDSLFQLHHCEDPYDGQYTSRPTQEEARIINENYRTYCNKNYKHDGLITNPENLKPLETFHSGKMNSASDFMKNYIEATYNIFQIQQTKIEALERALASLNAKIDG
tara:strand:+ start:2715 stop:3257 length:543 start_codon:yes stop_codon:yes gene_type:complete